MARIYTRTGDGGQTHLGDGSRADKSSARIELYGEVDELNSIIGLVRASLGDPPYARRKAARRLDAMLEGLQQELFDLGAELATPPGAAHPQMQRMGEEHTRGLEVWMDEMQPDLPPLESFVLPGGGQAGALLHLARTVCRRAERTVTTLVRKRGAEAATARYLNRLSDLLFVQSRWIAAKTGRKEVLWQPGAKRGTRGAKKRRT